MIIRSPVSARTASRRCAVVIGATLVSAVLSVIMQMRYLEYFDAECFSGCWLLFLFEMAFEYWLSFVITQMSLPMVVHHLHLISNRTCRLSTEIQKNEVQCCKSKTHASWSENSYNVYHNCGNILPSECPIQLLYCSIILHNPVSFLFLGCRSWQHCSNSALCSLIYKHRHQSLGVCENAQRSCTIAKSFPQ